MEAEPNDQFEPGAILSFAEDDLCFDGILASRDIDIFGLRIAAGDGLTRRAISLSTEAEWTGRVEIHRLERADDGAVTGADRLYRSDIAVAGTLDLPPLLLQPGDYLIGLIASRGADTPYRLTVASAGGVAAVPAEGAVLAGAFAAGTVAEARDLTIAWQVDAAGAETLWTIEGQAPPGARLSLALFGEDGGELAAAAASGDDGRITLADLALDSGTYRIALSARQDGLPLMLTATPAAARTASREAEPNDTLDQASPFALSQAMDGRFFGGSSRPDVDVFRLEIADRQHLEIAADRSDGGQITLTLLDGEGAEVQARSGEGTAALPGLVLPPGPYGVQVEGADGAEAAYRLEAVDLGPVGDTVEHEPNDSVDWASPIGERLAAQGELVGSETDFHRLTLAGDPGIWRIQAAGAGVDRVRLFNASGEAVAEATPSPGEQVVRLSSLLLAPGDHWVEVSGSDARYLLRVVRMEGAAPPGAAPPAQPVEEGDAQALDPDLIITDEIEPNHELGRAMPLGLGQRRTGLLDFPRDLDLYSFYLAAETVVELAVEPPGDAEVSVDLGWGRPEDGVATIVAPAADAGADAEPTQWTALLPPGDYYLSVSSDHPSRLPYAVAVEPQTYFERPADLEVNDAWYLSRPVALGARLAGQLLDGDEDWYEMPRVDQPTPVTIRPLTPPAERLYLEVLQEVVPDPAALWQVRDVSPIREVTGSAAEGWQFTLPADSRVHIGFSGGAQTYDIAIAEPGGDGADQGPPPAPVALELALETTEIAAFHRQGQRVAGQLILTNTGDTPLQLDLVSHAGDARWQVDLAHSSVELAGGAGTTVDLAVSIAPDVWSGNAIPLTVGARPAGVPGAPVVSASVDLMPGVDIPPVHPSGPWTLPDGMLGGLNLAWAGLGGQADEDALALIDGLINEGGTAAWRSRTLDDYAPTLHLAGETPVLVSGITLLPPPAPRLMDRLRRFELHVSTDGTTFAPVLAGTLDPLGGEQAFALEAPVAATHVRLHPVDSHFPDGRGAWVSLGELRVIGVPGDPPPGGAVVNLADEALGGRLVWSDPWFDPTALLVRDEEAVRLSLPADRAAPIAWVIGFRDGRAAQITGLGWQEAERTDADAALAAVELAISNESAVGPWQPLGTWTLERDATGAAHLALDAPVWARYVRFSVDAATAGRRPILADAIAVFEQPVGDGYLSAIGEWGQGSRAAIFERLEAAAGPADLGPDAGDTADAATPLAFDRSVGDTVALASDVDWYRVTVPEPGGHLSLALTNQPSVDVTLTVYDAEGAAVPGDLSLDSSGTVRFATWLPPGAYFVEVEEPPRSIALLWDTSGSVASFVPAIFSAVRGFTRGIVPGREEVNLFPFSDNPRPLLEHWTDDATLAFAAAHGYDRREVSSSDAHLALLAGLRELQAQDGVRAAIVITDGVSPGYGRTPELWEAFATVRPRVFALAVPTNARDATGRELRNMMQDWAGVNGGYFTYLVGEQAVDVNFRRLAAWLRQPKPYRILAHLDPAPPAPGQLRVALGEDAAAGVTGAVEIILDASGSMLQPMGGGTRFNVAVEALRQIVNGVLPAGTPFAVRVFGQGAPGSCDTDLEVALAPLEPQQVEAAIAPLVPVNLARTPIGASLAQVPADMAAAAGPHLVVLLTDGEETCGGDPQAEIERLRAAGTSLRINIVGFAINDAALAATFRDWAQLGGGAYFDAGDPATLLAALSDAVSPTVTVLAGGVEVARGTVGGDAIALPAGRYDLRLDTEPPRSLDPVTIQPGGETIVTID
ncbi:MAG: pre-peptidase C-terminal domain-containing protein [Rhodospirillaceae bacterium]|nr:pre-peptidase C-terminal domain-containing protein [Rhodospirillaceae bacterium]